LSPVLIFYLLNNFELGKRYRPILTVTTTENINLSPDDVIIKPDSSLALKYHTKLKKKYTNYMFTLSVINDGNIPAQDIYFYIYPINKGFRWPNDVDVRMDPPDSFKKIMVDGSLRITLDRAIGIGERVTFHVQGLTVPKSININLLGGRVYHKHGAAEMNYNKHKSRQLFSGEN
jgi:hypothetical protein